MRLVLECHSQIQCCDEATSYSLVFGEPGPSARRWLGLKVPCLTEQFAEPVLYDKFILPETPNVYGGQPLIFMVRDVRATVASMDRLRKHGRSWIDTDLIPTLRANIVGKMSFRDRYGEEIARLGGARHGRLARAALYWRYKTEALFTYLERGFPVLTVRYEDLVTRPSLELLRICGFLQVPWEPALLKHHAFAHAEVDTSGVAVGGTDATRPIDPDSLMNWHHAFTESELSEMLEFAGWPQALLYPASAAA